MTFLALLKMFGFGWIKRQLASAIGKHTSPDGYKVLATAFSECLDGCNKQDPDAVAQGITDALSSIR